MSNGYRVGRWLLSQGPTAAPNRADYMNEDVTHDEYYGAIAKTAGLDFSKHEDAKKWAKALEQGNKHLNSFFDGDHAIPLVERQTFSLRYWEGLARCYPNALSQALRAHGDHNTPSSLVCTVKAAARLAAKEVGL